MTKKIEIGQEIASYYTKDDVKIHKVVRVTPKQIVLNNGTKLFKDGLKEVGNFSSIARKYFIPKNKNND